MVGIQTPSRSQANLQLGLHPQVTGATPHPYPPHTLAYHTAGREKRKDPRGAQELASSLSTLWNPHPIGQGAREEI